MRKCGICTHPKKDEIENLLSLNNVSYRKISKEFGVHRDGIKNHKINHMGVTVHGVTYGDFNALNKKTNTIVKSYTEKISKLNDEIEYWKNIAQYPKPSLNVSTSKTDLDVALAMLHMSGVPSNERELSARKRELSIVFHPDKNPGMTQFMQDINWAVDVVAKHLQF